MDDLFHSALDRAHHRFRPVRHGVSRLAWPWEGGVPKASVWLADPGACRTLLVFTGIFTFLVDAYPHYAASAMAANTFTRCTLAGEPHTDLAPPGRVWQRCANRVSPRSGLSFVRAADVQFAGLPVGVNRAGLPDGGHAALPVLVFPARQDYSAAQQIRGIPMRDGRSGGRFRRPPTRDKLVNESMEQEAASPRTRYMLANPDPCAKSLAIAATGRNRMGGTADRARPEPRRFIQRSDGFSPHGHVQRLWRRTYGMVVGSTGGDVTKPLRHRRQDVLGL